MDPIRPTDAAARALARRLLTEARQGALAVRDPETGGPYAARVAVLWDGGLHLLVSSLAHHARALAQDAACALLIGEPGRGDPLAHPRLTLQGQAEPADKAALRAAWLAAHPKAALYFDFTDFAALRLAPTRAHLVAGFGRAYRLAPEDLEGPEASPGPGP